jgi:hypothetical protein
MGLNTSAPHYVHTLKQCSSNGTNPDEDKLSPELVMLVKVASLCEGVSDASHIIGQ